MQGYHIIPNRQVGKYIIRRSNHEKINSITLCINDDFQHTLRYDGIDAEGNDAELPEGASIKYSSTRPWVIDVKDGKLYDGGNDGSTIITVTASNGIKGSLLFIRSTSDTAITSGFENNNTEAGSKTASDGYAYYGYRTSTPVTQTDDNSRVDGKPYISGTGKGYIRYDGSCAFDCYNHSHDHRKC